MACTAGVPDCQQDKHVRYLLPLEQPHLEEVLIVGVSHSTQSVGLHTGESAPVPVEACWQQPLTWKPLIQPSAAQHTSCCAGKLGAEGKGGRGGGRTLHASQKFQVHFQGGEECGGTPGKPRVV